MQWPKTAQQAAYGHMLQRDSRDRLVDDLDYMDESQMRMSAAAVSGGRQNVGARVGSGNGGTNARHQLPGS